jgi:hypothetical protein
MKKLFAHVEWSDLLTAEIGMHRIQYITLTFFYYPKAETFIALDRAEGECIV